MSVNEPSIAVAHEHHPQRGGGEVVAEDLARAFDAPLYSGYVKEAGRPDDPELELIDLFGDGLTGRLVDNGLPHDYILRDAYYQFGWERAGGRLDEFDVIVQSGNNPGWYVPRDNQTIIKYVHSPPRTPYDMFAEYADSLFARAYAKIARVLYKPNLAYPTRYVANSDLVAERIRKYWDIPEEKIEVVYPGVDTESYGPEHGEQRDYYFTFSRLYKNKRIGEIVQAFNELPDKRLVIGGSGPERERLEAMAGENIEFVGYVSEEEKRRRLAECKAFIFAARNEDFGIVPIEAMASGTPVIGVRDGFTQHQIRDGESGVTFERGVPSLRSAVWSFDRHGVSWDADDIQRYADRFSIERFNREMRAVVEDAVSETEITPKCQRDVGDVLDDPVPTRAVADGGHE